jgi:hypothetical protein
MQKALGALFGVMPFLFGVGFLAPLMAEVLQRLGLATVGGAPVLVPCLLIGGLWGAIATRSGRWI